MRQDGQRAPARPAPIYPLDRALRDQRQSYPHDRGASYGGGGDLSDRDLTPRSAPPPPRSARSPHEFSTGRSAAALNALARELAGLRFRGAHYYVHQHRFEHITAALTEVLVAVEAGDELRNPAGMVRWLVSEAERAESAPAAPSVAAGETPTPTERVRRARGA